LAGRRSRRYGRIECAIVRGILLTQSEAPPRRLYVMNVTKLALQIALFTEVPRRGFSEVSMQDPANTAISGAHRSLLRASALRGMKLHVAAVDGYALRWLISRFLPVEPRAFEPLTKGNATKEARDGGQCRSLVRASARAALLHKATSSVRLVHLSLRFLPAN
jgi:hypothetical protein